MTDFNMIFLDGSMMKRIVTMEQFERIDTSIEIFSLPVLCGKERGIIVMDEIGGYVHRPTWIDRTHVSTMLFSNA